MSFEDDKCPNFPYVISISIMVIFDFSMGSIGDGVST
jgi:hypothetical protein